MISFETSKMCHNLNTNQLLKYPKNARQKAQTQNNSFAVSQEEAVVPHLVLEIYGMDILTIISV